MGAPDATRHANCGSPWSRRTIEPWCFPYGAMKSEVEQEDFASFATIRSVSVRHFVIRYSETIARTPVQNVYVEDANGRIWNADSVEKSDDRKRFITIRGLSENTAAPVVPETPVDPDDMTVGAYALAVQAGIRRYARTVNMVNTADFYEGGFPRRMRATFVNDEVISVHHRRAEVHLLSGRSAGRSDEHK